MTVLLSDPFSDDLATKAYLGDSGIVLNDVDEYGVEWAWESGNARGQKPAPREETGDRSNRDGQWDATRFYGPRVRSLEGTCYAPDHLSLHQAEQRLRNAVGVATLILRTTEPGWDGYSTVRQQGELLWTETSTGFHQMATFSLSVFAADPYAYSSTEHSFDTGFPFQTGGLIWPATWPATWNATSSAGQVFVTNPGSESVSVVFTLVGPVTNAVIANPDTGATLRLANPDGGVLLNAGEFLEIDTGRHTVLLQGQASRRSWASGDWLQLPPGDSTIGLAGVADPAAHLYGTFRAKRL